MIYTLISLWQQSPQLAIILLLASLLGVCVAISFHEWAHAFVAYKLGDPTARNMGRMSLDPLRHLDPLGAVCFVLLGFGWAKPVIVNSRNLKHFRRDDLLISIAGPLMNLLLSFVFFGILFFTVSAGWVEVGYHDAAYVILNELVLLNIVFAVFNVFPIPPLDGFHVLSSLFIRKNYPVVAFFQKYGFLVLLALIILGVTDIVIGAAEVGLLNLYSAFFGLFV